MLKRQPRLLQVVRGTSDVKAVREMLVGVVKGIKEVASATLPKGKAATLHRNVAQRPR